MPGEILNVQSHGEEDCEPLDTEDDKARSIAGHCRCAISLTRSLTFHLQARRAAWLLLRGFAMEDFAASPP
jgi:hypothetical protein